VLSRLAIDPCYRGASVVASREGGSASRWCTRIAQGTTLARHFVATWPRCYAT